MSSMSPSRWIPMPGRRSLTMSLLGAGLMLLAACDSNDNGGAPAATVPAVATVEQTATPEMETQETPEIGGTVAEDELRQVVDAWSSLQSYQIEGEVTRTAVSEGVINISLRSIPPERQHLTVTMGGQNFEWMTVGSNNYAKFGSAWMQIPGGPSSMGSLPLNPNEFLQEIETLENLSGPDYQVTRVGTETIDGVECEIWEMQSNRQVVESRFWIGMDDHLPRRIETGGDEGQVVLTVSEFNSQFAIEPPI